MVGETDNQDKNESRKIAIVLVSLVFLLSIAVFLMLPLVSELVAEHMSPGLGLRDSAVIAFFVTVALMVLLAVVSGDGLLGELQFVLGGFFLFFVIFWLMIAWIF